jgi:hypothetical protein
MAMRNRFNWVTEGANLLPANAIGNASDEGLAININFVTPSKKPEPIDITPPPPPSPYADAKPDLSRPAIEPPRPRFRTSTGAIFEAPPKGTDWLR